MHTRCSLGVEQEASHHDYDDGQELQETHANQSVREQVLLHRGIACHANDKSCEKLADSLGTAANSDHGDCTAEDRHASISLREWCSQTSSSQCCGVLSGKHAAPWSQGCLGQDTGSTDSSKNRHGFDKN